MCPLAEMAVAAFAAGAEAHLTGELAVCAAADHALRLERDEFALNRFGIERSRCRGVLSEVA